MRRLQARNSTKQQVDSLVEGGAKSCGNMGGGGPLVTDVCQGCITEDPVHVQKLEREQELSSTKAQRRGSSALGKPQVVQVAWE